MTREQAKVGEALEWARLALEVMTAEEKRNDAVWALAGWRQDHPDGLDGDPSRLFVLVETLKAAVYRDSQARLALLLKAEPA